jgi:hypothetical protein
MHNSKAAIKVIGALWLCFAVVAFANVGSLVQDNGTRIFMVGLAAPLVIATVAVLFSLRRRSNSEP